MALTLNRKPCLIMAHDDLTTFKVELANRDEPDRWDVLKQPQQPAVETIQVNDSLFRKTDSKRILLQLALAIKSHLTISTMRFDCCHIEELGHLLAVKSGQLHSWHFDSCRIDYAAALTLCCMLELDLIHELSFIDCFLEDRSWKAIDAAMSQNRSLRTFACPFNRGKLTTATGVCGMLQMNPHLVQLELTVSAEEDSLRDILHAANRNATPSLERLFLYKSNMKLQSVETILMMAFVLKKFQEVRFNGCSFSQEALEFFIQTLSQNKILDCLSLEYVNLSDNTFGGNAPTLWNINCGNVQVRKLSLAGTKFHANTLSDMLNDISNNAGLQSLNLNDGVMTDDAYRRMCNVLLLPNRGPTELYVDEISRTSTTLIIEALQQNTSLKSLSIGDFEDASLVTFARGVATLTGLRKLTIRFFEDEECLEEFFQALERSLEQNTTLLTLSLCGVGSDDDIAMRYLPPIRRWLALNRVGRHSLMTAQRVPVGLWPRVLSRSSMDAEGIYFVLTGKPDIIIPTRKRKDRSEGSE